MGLRIKICGITQVEQATAIAQMGATALGFICVKQSPRYVSPEQIGTMVAALPIDLETGAVGCDRIGVFVNASVEEMVEAAAIGNLSGIQLHGNESPEQCHALRLAHPNLEIIKALRIRHAADLATTLPYEAVVDSLLLDAHHPSLPGGTGKTLDWQTLQRFYPSCPWFLAGGLTPHNIQVALSQVTPDGIDLSSGVEHSPGDKDLAKVGQLFAALSNRD